MRGSNASFTNAASPARAGDDISKRVESAGMLDSRRFEHDVLRAVIQHVAAHLVQLFPALGDLERMIAGEQYLQQAA